MDSLVIQERAKNHQEWINSRQINRLSFLEETFMAEETVHAAQNWAQPPPEDEQGNQDENNPEGPRGAPEFENAAGNPEGAPGPDAPSGEKEGPDGSGEDPRGADGLPGGEFGPGPGGPGFGDMGPGPMMGPTLGPMMGPVIGLGPIGFVNPADPNCIPGPLCNHPHLPSPPPPEEGDVIDEGVERIVQSQPTVDDADGGVAPVNLRADTNDVINRFSGDDTVTLQGEADLGDIFNGKGGNDTLSPSTTREMFQPSPRPAPRAGHDSRTGRKASDHGRTHRGPLF